MRVVALLRGVNVGGHNRLRMADLRAAVGLLGHTDVSTYLQSGNVVFNADVPPDFPIGESIGDCLFDEFGLRVAVLTRTASELASIVKFNPYDCEDPTKVVVAFVAGVAQAPNLDLAEFAPEGLTVHGREMYLNLPFGQGRSPLVAALTKVGGDQPSTARNWRTVLALAEMSAV